MTHAIDEPKDIDYTGFEDIKKAVKRLKEDIKEVVEATYGCYNNNMSDQKAIKRITIEQIDKLLIFDFGEARRFLVALGKFEKEVLDGD